MRDLVKGAVVGKEGESLHLACSQTLFIFYHPRSRDFEEKIEGL